MEVSRRRSLFRPCIDLHGGKVKQIVGGSLKADDAVAVEKEDKVEGTGGDGGAEEPKTNFVANEGAEYFAQMYKDDNCVGGHVIKLGSNPANDEAARKALATWPNGLQVGGGIVSDNAEEWLSAGASHVIVTSFLFTEGGTLFSFDRLRDLSTRIGKERLVVDLSCRRVLVGEAEAKEGSGESDGIVLLEDGTRLCWQVATNKWQTLADLRLSPSVLKRIAEFCVEFLVHAADVEGLCRGIDEELVQALGRWSPIPVTYAGGARCVEDLARVERLSNGCVDLTIGSALDIFGGSAVRYRDCIRWNAGEALTSEPSKDVGGSK
uniref:Uncharacterized protein n=1 Tax=Chromera velia CCMP2878 TaxID=1169474 RepID=A0A0G4HPS9_9ALVE|mmetsp:Transcript_55352/g.108351  ORF Transcript_55352/g.108351 Transcript_55352/m.108351 type:complete len:322 (+) Transcript_55352:173-1138(+)|eukprot:Cvel_29924.t1-p1 / transcript=Cvel_29924.t1 / gene=Cvel_29924 / organism=Chromera_velia_CCMP2878 / gene_product=none 1-(5-phosphoribosyl)-5-[(5-, putative / transcript_product=none 1-(5-phosphoribosyl)-5-[(5-, putative / location=Cvel_scaffold4185:8725-10352(+) / protein_length=321 / sequence_SO=supercontig / SO=protein_coding / is_pseudo=false